MMPLLWALLPQLVFLVDSSDDVCYGSACNVTTDEASALLQLRGDTAVSATWTPGCEWIEYDDCVKQDVYACDCRAKNPGGKCTKCPYSRPQSIPKKKFGEVCDDVNVCMDGLRCNAGRYGGRCCAPYRDTRITSVPDTCSWTAGCEWLADDDCKNQDRHACDCRANNPNGPCTTCPNPRRQWW